MKLKKRKDKNRRINIKLPAVWEPKCCVQHVTRKAEQFRTACEITEDQVESHCRHLFFTMWPRLFAKTKPWSGIGGRRRSWQMDNHLSGHNGCRTEPNPLLLFKLYRKLPSKTQTNCRKYNCNSTFQPGGISGAWETQVECGCQMRKRESETACLITVA